AADAEPEHDLRALGVGELGPLDERTGAAEELDPRANLTAVHARPGLAGEMADLKLDRTGGDDRRERPAVLVDRLAELQLLDQSRGAGHHGLGTAPMVTGAAVGE